MKVFGFGDFSTKPGKGDGDDKAKKPKKGKVVGWLVQIECQKCREERQRRRRRAFSEPSMN